MATNDENDKGTVLNALGDAAVEATQLALENARAGKYSDAYELSNLTERLTSQIFRIEDHTNTRFNRSGCDVGKSGSEPKEALAAINELRNP